MEKEIIEEYIAREFIPEKTIEVNHRIYEHDIDTNNWTLALLDEKNLVSLINKDFENFCNFEKIHRDKINLIKCYDDFVISCSDDKTLKFWNKKTQKLETTLTCKNEIFFFVFLKKKF